MSTIRKEAAVEPCGGSGEDVGVGLGVVVVGLSGTLSRCHYSHAISVFNWSKKPLQVACER